MGCADFFVLFRLIPSEKILGEKKVESLETSIFISFHNDFRLVSLKYAWKMSIIGCESVFINTVMM